MASLTVNLTVNLATAWLASVAPGAALRSDSRQITPGDVFFSYADPDPLTDPAIRRGYIAAAIVQGAAAILFDPQGMDWSDAWLPPHLALPELKQCAGPIAHAFYGMPDSAMYSIGITGTNGKTSCAVWLGQALAHLAAGAAGRSGAAGHSGAVAPVVAVIGTLGVGCFGAQGAVRFDVTGYTTPDAVLLAHTLAQLRAGSANAVAIEVSSIGLDQGRLNGMHFDVALMTNLSRDHLDYHADMASYEAAKSMLFDWPGLQSAVLNLDDAMGLRLLARLKSQSPDGLALYGYTLQDGAARPDLDGVVMLRASALRSRPAGLEFHLACGSVTAQVKTRLVGRFNISNALGVMAVLLAKGVPLRAAIDAIEALTPAPGRMQQVGGSDGPMVVIDYAHTPDALEKTLLALRPMAQERNGKLWCVFGCGGERDRGKRAAMGALSQLADHVLVTSDNPRFEEPLHIIEQIVAGMDLQHPGCTLQTVPDRAAAILAAIKHAARSDVILLAGKGHEPSMEIKGKKLPFSDADHAALALAARVTMKKAP